MERLIHKPMNVQCLDKDFYHTNNPIHFSYLFLLHPNTYLEIPTICLLNLNTSHNAQFLTDMVGEGNLNKPGVTSLLQNLHDKYSTPKNVPTNLISYHISTPELYEHLTLWERTTQIFFVFPKEVKPK